MDAIGINGTLLLIQLIPLVLFIGLPIIALVDLAKKKMSGTTLAVWVLIICAVPLLGALAYWIVKPTAETRN
ncbi:MAG TPA: PLDc N-terminal domain-containing protein [Anaerolineales bacterium]|nr:PLDc N-terminal domain-containing protein [Anaerolineales bacterium]